MENSNPPINEPEEDKTPDPDFVDDEGNIAIRHLYGEIIWLKVYEYPYWPAMVLDPRWLPLSLIESLKINKKKAHNRVIVQFIDEYNSSQVVSLKSICYPFEAYYDQFKENKKIKPEFIAKAKALSEITRIERCRIHNPDTDEATLLQPNVCIVCHKPIEDLDSVDIRIYRGNPFVEPTEEHFQNKSYYRCVNPQCLSLYHKACVPESTFNQRCGICKMEPPPEKRKQSIHVIDEKKKENDDSRSRRYESRRDTDDDERRGVKRQPVRSTRAPTYHEENESSDEEDKRAAMKRRKLASTRTKTVDSKTSTKEEIKFEKIASEDVFEIVKNLFLSVYDNKIGRSEESAFVKDFKRKCRSIVAWFSTFGSSQQHLLFHFFSFLSYHSIDHLKDFAVQTLHLLEKKIVRHNPSLSVTEFANNTEIYTVGLEGKRLDAMHLLTDHLSKPEFSLLCRFIESVVFNANSESEEYDKMIQSILSKGKDKEWLSQVISGTICIKDVVTGSDSYIVF